MNTEGADQTAYLCRAATLLLAYLKKGFLRWLPDHVVLFPMAGNEEDEDHTQKTLIYWNICCDSM